jgi:hypothetical protein
MPMVCRAYPRTQRYRLELERSLSPACEATLQLLWETPNGVTFRSDPLPEEERRETALSGDPALLAHAPALRAVCVALLQDRRLHLSERILTLGLLLRELTEGADLSAWLTRCDTMLHTPEGASLSASLPVQDETRGKLLFLSSNLRVLLELCARSSNHSDPGLHGLLKEVLACFTVRSAGGSRLHFNMQAYDTAKARFDANFSAHEYFFENLAVSVWFHLALPDLADRKALWKGFVGFCELMSFYKFMATMGCRDGTDGSRDDLFDMIVLVSRSVIESTMSTATLQSAVFPADGAALPHLATLLRNG